jgi:hypothetical protein
LQRWRWRTCLPGCVEGLASPARAPPPWLGSAPLAVPGDATVAHGMARGWPKGRRNDLLPVRTVPKLEVGRKSHQAQVGGPVRYSSSSPLSPPFGREVASNFLELRV